MSVANVQGAVFMLGWKGEYARGNAEISDEHALALIRIFREWAFCQEIGRPA